MGRTWFFIILLFIGSYQQAPAQTHAELEKQMLQLFNAGKFSEAIPVAIKVKDAARKEYGDTTTRYVLSLTNLAFIYEQTENYIATEPLYREVIDIRKKTVGEKHAAFAVALNDLANAYFASRDYQSAKQLYKEAIAIQREVYGNLHPEYWVIAKNIGNTYRKMHRPDEAIFYLQECLAIAKKIYGDKHTEYYHALESLAIAQSENGNFKISLLLCKELATLTKEINKEEDINYATWITMIGRLYIDLGIYDSAELYMKKGAELRKNILGEENVHYAQSLNNLGALYQVRGDLKMALSFYEKALAIRKRILGEEHPDYGQTLSNIASIYQEEANYAVAEGLYKQALAIRKKADGEENSFYTSILSNLASMYTEIRRNTEAEQLHRNALAIRKKTVGENHPDYAESLNYLGLVLDNMARYAEAEQSYKLALSIHKKVFGEDHPAYAATLNNLGNLYVKMSRYAEAEDLFKQAFAIRKRINGEEHPDYVRVLDNLANLYNNTGNYKEAEFLYQQVLAIRKKIAGESNPDFATSLRNLGALYLANGKYTEAEKLYKAVLEVYKNTLGEQHPEYAGVLHNLGELYRRTGNYKTGEPLLLQSIAIRQKILGFNHPDNAGVLQSLAYIYEAKGDYLKAEELLDSSNSIMFYHVKNNFINLSETEKMQWWENEASRYELAPSLLVSNSHSSQAYLKKTFNRQIQLKGFVLKDGTKILEQVRQQGSPQLKSLLSEWQTNKAMLAKQYALTLRQRMAKFDSLEKQTNELEKQINQQSSVFRINQQVKQIGFELVQHSLEPGEAAIEFIRFNYYKNGWTDSIFYAAFIVLPDHTAPQFVLLCEEKKLGVLLDTKNNSSASFVKQLYRGLETRTKGQGDGRRADSLFNLVWKPIQPFLKGVKKINIAPAGLLNRISFNALSSDSNRYLIDEYKLRQFSSVGQIAEEAIEAATKTGDEIILYGGIDFEAATGPLSNDKPVMALPEKVQRSIRGGSWNSLPGTLDEVKSISQLFISNSRTAKTITGNAATEEDLKALSGNAPRILHLSTHGFSLPDAKKNKNDNKDNNQFSMADNPLLRSGVIMAGANRVWKGGTALPGNEDGIVTAYEISNLDLSNTELVVLSACETALGDIRGTEGVFGLQRSFKLAGAQQMILSLWQVPDKETVELMNLFYSNKLKGNPTVDAFNQAQETMRKKYPVYYWAAFVLVE